MSPRKTVLMFGALLLGALLVGAGAAAAGIVADGDDAASPGTQSSTAETNGSITVGASGAVQAEPDQAVVRLAVEARDDDPADARSTVAENASNMRDALADLGLDDDQVRTVGFHVFEDRERPRDPEAEPEITYRARHQFEVELDDVDRVGDVIDAAMAGGATTVNGVEFTLSAETRDDLQQAALRDAMDNARLQADTIADSADRSVTDVRSVTAGDVRAPSQRVRLATMAEGDAGGTDLEPGSVTVTASVTVEYDVRD